ncbi:hypothetical protein JXR93_14230 [bacterium]|nr:hypothetical protein [bacterium]
MSEDLKKILKQLIFDVLETEDIVSRILEKTEEYSICINSSNSKCTDLKDDSLNFLKIIADKNREIEFLMKEKKRLESENRNLNRDLNIALIEKNSEIEFLLESVNRLKEEIEKSKKII